jgi:hypothetical protein
MMRNPVGIQDFTGTVNPDENPESTRQRTQHELLPIQFLQWCSVFQWFQKPEPKIERRISTEER